MGRTLFRRKNIIENVKTDETRITSLEVTTNAAADVVPGTTTSDLSFQWQSTNFSEARGTGDARIWINAATSTIDEESNVAVKAYATFDDIGGNAPVAVFNSTEVWIPILDAKGLTAYYHSHPLWSKWESSIHPEVVHTKQFMTGHSASLNVPGVNANDRAGVIRYDSNAGFNISASISTSLWFYPTDTTQIASETFRFLLYRYIDASNYFMILLKPSDQKIYVFTNEAAAVTKLVSTGTINTNAWNLIIFTYNPATNALVMYLNNSSSSSTPSDTPPTPYTTDARIHIGGIETLQDKRFTGYLDNFVFWSGKILTSTEAGNMWNHGTII